MSARPGAAVLGLPEPVGLLPGGWQAQLLLLCLLEPLPVPTAPAPGTGSSRTCSWPELETLLATAPAQHPSSSLGEGLWALKTFYLCLDSDLPDQCTPNPCDKEGTQICQDLMGNFFCLCRAGWGGRLCDQGKSPPPPQGQGGAL